MAIKANDDGTVTIGETTISEEQFAEMQTTMTSQADMLADVQPAIDAAAKYGIKPDVYIQQAEAGLELVGNLIQEEVIDPSGKLLSKGKVEVKDLILKDKNVKDPAKEVGNPDVKAILQEAIEPLLGKITSLEKTNLGLIQSQLETKILSEHDGVTRDEVGTILQTAMLDKSKDLNTHVEEFKAHKVAGVQASRAQFAKEFGVDLDQLDKNKLFESDPGAAAQAIVGEKKVSFRKGEGNVSPREAAAAFLNQAIK